MNMLGVCRSTVDFRGHGKAAVCCPTGLQTCRCFWSSWANIATSFHGMSWPHKTTGCQSFCRVLGYLGAIWMFLVFLCILLLCFLTNLKNVAPRFWNHFSWTLPPSTSRYVSIDPSSSQVWNCFIHSYYNTDGFLKEHHYSFPYYTGISTGKGIAGRIPTAGIYPGAWKLNATWALKNDQYSKTSACSIKMWFTGGAAKFNDPFWPQTLWIYEKIIYFIQCLITKLLGSVFLLVY